MKKYFSFLILLLLTLFVYRSWFFSNFISAGDFSLTSLSFKDLVFIPMSWTSSGMGSNVSFLLFSYPLTFAWQAIGMLIGFLLAQKIVFYYMFIFISLISSYVLSKKILANYFLGILSSFIYTLNTYILMVVGGGQVGIALAYAIAPLVLFQFINVVEGKNKLKNSFFAGILLSLQVMFDIRVTYMTILIIFLLWVLVLIKEKNIKSLFYVFFLPGIFSILIHMFWILPTVFYRQNPLQKLGLSYTSDNAVRFLSFAKLENSISLLHPNWPENIFGKVNFMHPEFIILPIIAFTGIFFIVGIKERKKEIYLVLLILISILGAFLAKGSNEPLGVIYLWMFNNVPGFIMFRDPTKWYLWVAISYSILIPFSIWKIFELIKEKTHRVKNLKFLPYIFVFLVISYMLFLIMPAMQGQLTGTFRSSGIPQGYLKYQKFLSSQDNFSRTMWVPTTQRFAYYSFIHPQVSAQEFFNITDIPDIIKQISSSEDLLQNSSVKYVVVPEDSEGEIFLNDRKYDNKLYLKTLDDISKISYLRKVGNFGKITVFEVPNIKNHFWSPSKNLKLTYKYISPVNYLVKIDDAKKDDIVVFSENFDSKWVAKADDYDIQSTKFNEKFNSFILNKDGAYSLDIYYYPQVYVNIGIVISLVTLVGSLLCLVYLIKRR